MKPKYLVSISRKFATLRATLDVMVSSTNLLVTAHHHPAIFFAQAKRHGCKHGQCKHGGQQTNSSIALGTYFPPTEPPKSPPSTAPLAAPLRFVVSS
jgi:hypothetical protein